MRVAYTQKELEFDERMLNKVFSGEIVPSASRYLTKREKEQRACGICAYSVPSRRKKKADYPESIEKSERLLSCSFNHCPFHDMDRYNRYSDYCRANKLKIDKMMGKLFGTQIFENLETRERKKRKNAKEPYVPAFRQLTDREKWTIGVRDSQGYDSRSIAAEVGITEVQARKEVLIHRLKSH